MHVRYDSTNKWWEYSTDNVNFFRLEENPLIPGHALFIEGSAPSTPAAGRLALYAKDKGGVSALYLKDDAGTEREVGLAAPTIPKEFKFSYISVGNNGTVGTGQQVLKTTTLPAGTLATNGDHLHLLAQWITAANANSKTMKLKLGATEILVRGPTALNNQYETFEIWLFRTAAATQYFFRHRGEQTVGTPQSTSHLYGTAAETLANALAIDMTGEGTANNDVIAQFLSVSAFVQAP